MPSMWKHPVARLPVQLCFLLEPLAQLPRLILFCILKLLSFRSSKLRYLPSCWLFSSSCFSCTFTVYSATTMVLLKRFKNTDGWLSANKLCPADELLHMRSGSYNYFFSCFGQQSSRWVKTIFHEIGSKIVLVDYMLQYWPWHDGRHLLCTKTMGSSLYVYRRSFSRKTLLGAWNGHVAFWFCCRWQDSSVSLDLGSPMAKMAFVKCD